jgi:hypothetical protein
VSVPTEMMSVLTPGLNVIQVFVVFEQSSGQCNIWSDRHFLIGYCYALFSYIHGFLGIVSAFIHSPLTLKSATKPNTYKGLSQFFPQFNAHPQSTSSLLEKDQGFMGRRAKNKQPAPEPLWDPSKPSGKRKADLDLKDRDGGGRPAKKAKGDVETKVKLKGARGPANNMKGGSGRGRGRAIVGRRNVGDDGEDVDGWEDVEDEDEGGVNLKAHVR